MLIVDDCVGNMDGFYDGYVVGMGWDGITS